MPLRLIPPYDGHLRPSGMELAGDGAADPPGTPRHERDFTGEIDAYHEASAKRQNAESRSRREYPGFLCVSAPLRQAVIPESRNFSTSGAVPKVIPGAPGTIFLSSPLNTLPGPSSRNRAPGASRAASRMHSTQRTGAVSWSARSRLASVPLRIGSARHDAASGDHELIAKSIRELQAIRRDAAAIGYVALELEARLALGEAETRSPQGAGGRARLTALERDAMKRGFMLIAKKAARAGSKPL